jgi:Ni/Co efflux regulator RcnB
MKRFALAAAAALALTGPLAATAAYADPPGRHDNRGNHGDHRRDDNGRDNDRRGDNGRDDDRRDDNRWSDDRRDDNRWGDDRRDDNRWSDNRRGDERRHNRWDRRHNNGYTMDGQWYYGPPQAAYAHRAHPGYRQWRRGDRLPSYYRSQYREVDYRREHLRAPPRGYRYVEDDRGETLLVGIATGVILSILLNGD